MPWTKRRQLEQYRAELDMYQTHAHVPVSTLVSVLYTALKLMGEGTQLETPVRDLLRHFDAVWAAKVAREEE